MLNTLNAQSHEFNGSNNSSSNSNNLGGLNSLFRNTSFTTKNKLEEFSKKIINMYQTLTSVSINYRENTQAFMCKGVDAKTNDRKFELSVGISEEDGNEMVMSYVPIQNVQSLPEHFQDEIEFNVVCTQFFQHYFHALK